MIKFTGRVSDFLKIGVAAAAKGDVERVREILKAKPKWIHRVGSHGRTMLWEASHRGKLEMVKYLVRRKADIDACGSHYTPYYVEVSCYCIARYKGRDDVADFLLKKGAKVDIHTAAFLGDVEAVKKFLKRSKKAINAGHVQHGMAKKNDQGIEFVTGAADWATPLCYALRGGNVETVELLISKGAKIKGFEKQLFIAADDAPEMVKLLLENQADPEFAPDVFPDDKELYEIVSKFKKSKLDVTKCDELVYLCRGDRGGNPSEVKLLLKRGYDVNFQDHKGKTALHRAAKAGFVETVEILLRNRASVKLVDKDGETPLFDAVRSTIKNTTNKLETIRILLNANSNPKHENRKHQTPISLAQNGKTASKQVMKLLKKKVK